MIWAGVVVTAISITNCSNKKKDTPYIGLILKQDLLNAADQNSSIDAIAIAQNVNSENDFVWSHSDIFSVFFEELKNGCEFYWTISLQTNISAQDIYINVSVGDIFSRNIVIHIINSPLS